MMGKKKKEKRDEVAVLPIGFAPAASSGCLMTILTLGLIGRKR